MPRFLCAAVFLCCASLRAAVGFPELPGFFIETADGIYEARGARLAVLASQHGVYLDTFALRHRNSAHPAPVGVDPTGALVNVYRAGLAQTGRRAYRAVEYRDLYPGVTLRLSFAGRAIKADYIVAPGADPRSIRFRYQGVAARLEGEDLVAGALRQPAPTVLQGNDELPARYAVGRDGWVRFVIAPHDPRLPLVIDPYVITGSAYLGGALADNIAAMAVDAAGYIYVAGATESNDFPTAPIQTRSGGTEAYVLKINPANLQVVYATYLGGSAEDRALSIAVDSNGSAYFTGLTASGDFPASPFYRGATDGFAARLTATGTLQYATFLGGSGQDSANGIALNPDGSAWVVGDTASSNMPLYGSSYQSANAGGQDAFLARINADGSLAYTSYFGGSGADRAVAVAVDSGGSVYVTGGTTSSNLPVLNAYRSYNSGMQDVFVAKLAAGGATLLYSTYIGGSGGVPGQGETGNWIGVDSNGAVSIVGSTGSNNFPVTASAVQSSFGGGATDAFVAKLSAAGTSLLYATYFGGLGSEEGIRGALANGVLYFGGNTSSAQGFVPVDAVQSTHGGDLDGFFAKLNGDLSSVLAFTYLGYTGTDSLTGLAVSSSAIILAGSSSSPAWLASGGFKGSYDGWVMTLQESTVSIQMNSTPAGVSFSVSGSGCSPASATTPATLNWPNGASCTVSFNTTQGTGETRSVFQSWADGGSANPRTIVATAASATYLMQFGSEYRLTGNVSPPGAGSINGAGAYYTPGSTAQISASANAGYQFSGWSEGASGSSNPVSVSMSAPKTVTANYNLLTSISNPAPVQLTVSGTGCAAGTYSAPVTLAWSPGANCSVGFPSTQVSGDVRWVFARWSDGATENPRTLPAAAGSAHTLEWNLEYRLTRAATPSGTGSISGLDGFYAAGSTLQLSATAAAGYQFSGWSGAASGTANPLSLVMNGAKSLTANFVPLVAQVTLNTNVSSPIQITVSGTGCSPGNYSAPVVLNWNEGAVCSVSTPTVQGADTRWVFENWADGPASNPRSITAVMPSATYTLRFATQYRLTRSTNGQGSVTGADSFYPAGTSIQLTASPATGYQFIGWSGTLVDGANPIAFPLNAPSTVVANFSTSPAAVNIHSNGAAQFTVAGSGCPSATYTAPTTVIWTTGTTCTIAAVSPQISAGTRRIFTGWSDGLSASSRSITASPGVVYTMAFTTEHTLTRTVSGQGTVSSADGYYLEGTTVQLTATPSAGHQFTGWTGSASSAANPLSLAIDGPKSVIANFMPTPAAVRIEANFAASFTVAGSGCPAGTYTAPATVTWANGSACILSVQQTDTGPDTRWAFTRWADGPVTNPRTITAVPGAVYTIVMGQEYRLTRSVSGQGTLSGQDGFYAAGSSLPITATPASGYQFAGWSGSASGTANPLQLVMNSPKSIAASFTAAAAAVRIETNMAVGFSVSGAGCPAGAFSAPFTLTWTSGTACTFSVHQPAADATARWTFSRWADGPASNPRSIVASPGAVYTIVMAADYKLTRLVSGPGTVGGVDGFYASGSTVQLTASPAAGFQFLGWAGSESGAANPLPVVMSGPKTVTANFGVVSAGVRIEANAAAQFLVSGSGCPAGTYTAPVNLSWGAGAICNISAVSPQGGPDSRLVFSHWSDGSQANPRSIAASAGVVYTLVFNTEYRLTRTVAGQGSVSGADGFYAAASTISLTATPAAGHQFTGWTGTGGSANPVSVRMDGPITMTANFTTIPGAAVETLSPLVGSGPSGTFTAQFSHGGGSGQLYLGYMLFLPTPNVVNYVATGSCLVEYNRISNGMRLIDDAGTGWLGPISGVVLGPSAGTLSNSRCTLNVAGASVSLTANTMNINAPVTFKSAVSPVMGTFLQALDVTGKWTGMTQFGNWTLGNGTPRPGPSILGVANSTSAGSYAVYTIASSHTSGASALAMVHLLIGRSIMESSPCQVVYFPGSKTLNLINDTGTALVSPEGVPPGVAGTIANSRCAINTGLSAQSVSGNAVTVTIPLTLQPGTFGGPKNVYVNAFDGMGQLTHWVQAATLLVQ